MGTTFHCWQCGEALADMILPVSRREACRGCGAEIHCCRMCVHFRRNRFDACAEERAEDVSDRERANFCDYFAPNEAAFTAVDDDTDAAAKARLEALFGGGEATPSSGDDVPRALEDLFGKPGED